jgi:hypothetical protein
MNQDGCMWAVILSSFVTGAAGIMRAAYSPSLTVPVQCEDGASPLCCVCYQPIRGIESGPVRRGCRLRMVAEIRLQETFWFCPRVRVLQCWLGSAQYVVHLPSASALLDGVL